MVSPRALHFVLKIGDRGANINFFRNVLGMKVIYVYILISMHEYLWIPNLEWILLNV